jgi:hypothetical protein
MAFTFHIPQSWEDAMREAHRSGALYRIRRSKVGPIYPGCWTGKATAVLQAHLAAGLSAEFGAEQLDRFSMFSAVTQQLPKHTGMLAPMQRDSSALRDEHYQVIRLIYRFARRAYKHEMDVGLAVPRKSSVGFPWFKTGDEGALIRQALLQDYIKNGSQIADLWAAGDTMALANGGLGFIPEYELTSVSLRLQPRSGHFVMKGGVPCGFETKAREVKTFDGRIEDMTVGCDSIFGPLASVMRSRQVAAHSATSNLLGQILWTRHRAGMYDVYKVFHPTDISASIKVCRELLGWSDPRDETYDFKTMDKSQVPLQYDAILRGFHEAGASEAYCNIHRANLFSAVIQTQDDTTGEGRPGFVVEGSPRQPLLYPHDVGHHSGHFATDTDNAINGSMTYFAALNMAGCYRKVYDLHSNEGCDEFLDEVVEPNLMYKPVPGCKAYMIINKGDDCLITYIDDATRKQVASVLASFGPIWEIEPEARTQILGRDVVGDSTLPFIDKAPANFCSPERFCTDHMKAFWMLGVPARDTYYSEHPDWAAVKRVIIHAFRIAYGTDPFELAAGATRPVAPAPTNAAELECLWNPEAITYKYAQQDVSSDFLDALGYYTSITPEQVASVCKYFK